MIAVLYLRVVHRGEPDNELLPHALHRPPADPPPEPGGNHLHLLDAEGERLPLTAMEESVELAERFVRLRGVSCEYESVRRRWAKGSASRETEE